MGVLLSEAWGRECWLGREAGVEDPMEEEASLFGLFDDPDTNLLFPSIMHRKIWKVSMKNMKIFEFCTA